MSILRLVTGSLHKESSQNKGKVWPKDECKFPPLEAKTVYKGLKTKQATITTKNFKFEKSAKTYKICIALFNFQNTELCSECSSLF